MKSPSDGFAGFLLQIQSKPDLSDMLIADLITIFLACFGYTQQYMLIRKERSPGKFSVYVTAFMISACILKAMFFFIAPYSITLFIQNFLITALCLMVIYQYVKFGGNQGKDASSIFKRFWQWPNFQDYIYFLAYFTIILGIITYQSVVNDWLFVSHFFAIISTCIEICAALPQVIAIHRAKSAEGVSKVMIGIWLCSDTYKTIYFILKHQPLAFVATGTVQALIDLILIAQFIVYRPRGSHVKGNLEMDLIDT